MQLFLKFTIVYVILFLSLTCMVGYNVRKVSELAVASLIWLFVDQLVQANFEENQNSSIPPGEGGTSGPVPSHQTL